MVRYSEKDRLVVGVFYQQNRNPAAWFDTVNEFDVDLINSFEG